MWIYLSTRNTSANKGLLDNVNEPKPVVPELTPDPWTIFRSHVAECALKSSRLVLFAARETENRHMVIRTCLDAFSIQNYHTFTHAEIVDVNAAAHLLHVRADNYAYHHRVAEDGVAVIVCISERVE